MDINIVTKEGMSFYKVSGDKAFIDMVIAYSSRFYYDRNENYEWTVIDFGENSVLFNCRRLNTIDYKIKPLKDLENHINRVLNSHYEWSEFV